MEIGPNETKYDQLRQNKTKWDKLYQSFKNVKTRHIFLTNYDQIGGEIDGFDQKLPTR